MTAQDTAIAQVQDAAARHGITYRGIADRSDGSGALLFVREVGTYAHYFSTGFFPTIEDAAQFSITLFNGLTPEEMEAQMNIYKNNKLFPHIKGVMLKEQRVTLTMSGKVNVVEMRDGADARAEVFFSDHPKSAIINRNQLLDIASVYGGETTDWKGQPVVLYGEHGTWFGKETWGLRVDKQATEQAARQASKNGKQNGSAEPPADVEDVPFDEDGAPAALFEDEAHDHYQEAR